MTLTKAILVSSAFIGLQAAPLAAQTTVYHYRFTASANRAAGVLDAGVPESAWRSDWAASGSASLGAITFQEPGRDLVSDYSGGYSFTSGGGGVLSVLSRVNARTGGLTTGSSAFYVAEGAYGMDAVGNATFQLQFNDRQQWLGFYVNDFNDSNRLNIELDGVSQTLSSTNLVGGGSISPSNTLNTGSGNLAFIFLGLYAPQGFNTAKLTFSGFGSTDGWILDYIRFGQPSSTMYWNGSNPASTSPSGGNGTWTKSGTNWLGKESNGLATAFNEGSAAYFRGNAGTVTLSGTGTFTAGSLNFERDGYILTGGTISAGSFNVTGTYQGPGDAALANRATVQSAIQGSLLKTGAGSLRLEGVATLASLNVNVGSIVFANAVTLESAGAVGASATVAFDTADGQEITFTSGLSGAGALSKSGAGALVLTGDLSHTGGTTLSAGALRIGNGGSTGTLSGNINNNGILVFDRSDDLAYGGIISGNGSLTKSGAGALTLTGAHAHSGGTTLAAGTLVVSGSLGAVSVASGATLRGRGAVGALQLSDGSMLSSGLDGSGTLTTGNLTLAAGAQVTFTVDSPTGHTSRAAFDTGSLAFGAGSNVRLGVGAPAYAGTYRLLSHVGLVEAANFSLMVNGLNSRLNTNLGFETPGLVTLVVGKNVVKWTGTTVDFSGNDAWVIGSSATAFQAGDDLVLDDTAASGVVSITAGVSPASLSFTGDIIAYTLDNSGGSLQAGSLSKTGSAILTLAGANSFAGGTVISSGHLRVGANDALGTGGLVINGGRLSGIGSSAARLDNAITIGADIALGDVMDNGQLTLRGAIALNGGNRTLAVDANVALSGGISNGALVKAGAGTLALSGSSTYVGGTRLLDGRVLAGNNRAFGTGEVRLEGGALSSLGSTARTLSNQLVFAADTSLGSAQTDTGSLTLTGAVNLGGTARNLDIQSYVTLSGVVSNGSFVKSGAGTLRLGNAANAYEGDTVVAGGVLYLRGGRPGAGAGITEVLNGASLHLSYLSSLGSERIVIRGDGHDGLGALASVEGSASVGGVVELAADARVNNSRAGSVLALARLEGTNRNLTFGKLGAGGATDGSYAVSRLELGSGSLAMEGTGRLSLLGPNDYTGGTTLRSGVLEVRHAQALGAGPLVVEGGILAAAAPTRGAAVPTIDTGRLLSTDGGVTRALELRAGEVTAAITGSGRVVKDGTGTLTLSSSASSYTTVTEVQAGVLRITKASALGSTAGATEVAKGAALEFMGFRSTYRNGQVVDRLQENLVLGGSGVTGGTAVLRQIAGVTSLSGTRHAPTGRTTLAGGITLLGRASIESQNGTLVLAEGPGAQASIQGDGHALGLGGVGNIILTRSLELGSGRVNKFGIGGLYVIGDRVATGGITVEEGVLSLGGRVNLDGVTAIRSGSLDIGAAGLRLAAQRASDGRAVIARIEGIGAVDGDVTVANSRLAEIKPGIRGFGSLTFGSLDFEGAAIVRLSRLWQYAATPAIKVEGPLQFQGAPGSVNVRIGVRGILNGTYRVFEYEGAAPDVTALRATVSGLGKRRAGEFVAANGIVDFVLDGDLLEWVGDINGNWDSTSSNWLLTAKRTRSAFVGGDDVVFADGAAGRSVNLTANRAAASVNFIHEEGIYTLAGAGRVTTGIMVKSGAGTLVLSGAHDLDFSADEWSDLADIEDLDERAEEEAFMRASRFTLLDGTVRVGHDQALGKAGLGVFLSKGRMTTDGAAARTFANNLLLEGSEVEFGDESNPGSIRFNGAADLLDAEAMTVHSELVLAGEVSGSAFAKRGAGRLVLRAASEFVDGITVEEGELRLAGAGSLEADITNLGLVTFELDSFDLVHGGDISGTGSVTKTGARTLTMAGITEATSLDIQGGLLLLNGAHTGDVTVASSATLGGSGTVAGLVTVSGSHTPGNSPGNPTYEDLVYQAGATVAWELADNSTSDPGVDFDQIDISGSLVFQGATLLQLRFDADGSAVDWSDEFWAVSREWKVYDLDDGATLEGISNLQLGQEDWDDSLEQSFALLRSGSAFSLSVNGNDILLTYSYAIPEPSTYGIALGGLALALAAFRRRKRNF